MTNEAATTRRPPTWVLALAVPALALIAVIATRALEGPTGAGTATSPRAGANAVIIRNFAFAPDRLTVPVGTVLKVTNEDGSTHTLTARDGAFTTGELDGGRSATVELTRAGSFAYYCKIHNYMTGTVVVK
jgi:plastocyanin